MFLGQILGERDFEVSSFKSERDVSSFSKPSKDLSKENYFFKTAVNFDKPMTTITMEESSRPQELRYEKKAEVDSSLKNLREVAFGPGDYGLYVDNVDFSDCRPYFSRDDLLSFIDFKILLNTNGLVQSIKKMTSCGDPIVDLVVLRKLKNAVFKDSFPPKTWVRIHFKLKVSL